MVLEYATGGSLLELFRRDEPPETPEERRYFLYGMMGLIKAVDKIQNLGGGPRNQRTGLYVKEPGLQILMLTLTVPIVI
jgi:hypothetical protein